MTWLTESIKYGQFSTNWLELLGFVTGAICVYLNTQQNVWGWFFGIINAVLYCVVFYNSKLYADTGLQVYYFITSIYGYWMWRFGGQNRKRLSVSEFPKQYIWPSIGIFIITTLGWGFLLGKFTDASLSYADSALTVASLIAQWMMARKYLQNWLIWIVADACYVAMYAYKSLYLTSVLYFVFLILAIVGYFSWKKEKQIQATLAT